jgi:flagellar hook-associated protein 3 FlgL
VISNLNPKSQLFLADAERIQDAASAASRRLSSGLRISQASDAPDRISPLLQLRAQLAHNTQLQTNLDQAQANANGADSALAAAIHLMDSAQSLAAQAASDLMTPDGRVAIDGQIQAIQQRMLAIGNTAVQGNYIFSGDDDRTPAYAADSSGTSPLTGVTPVSTAASTRQIEDPAGGSFAASKTAQEIFDARDANGAPTSDNVFAALQSLRAVLLDPNAGAAAIQATVANLEQASTHLNNMEAFYGSVQNRIQSAQDFDANLKTQIQTRIGQIADTDAAADALTLAQTNTQLSAAFQAQAQMPRKTLFDYLS